MIYLVKKVVCGDPQSPIYATTNEEKALQIYHEVKQDFLDNFEWIEVVSVQEDEFNIQSDHINQILTSYTEK